VGSGGDVLVYAKNHLLFDLSHLRQEHPAVAFGLDAHRRGRWIEFANTRNCGRVVHPAINTVLALWQAIATFVKPVPQVVIDAVHPINMATNTRTRRVQSMIGNTSRPAKASQVIEHLV